MAIVYAIKNGNWSDDSTWSSGVVPTAADDVDSGGYIVNVNVSELSCNKLTNNSGGRFNITQAIVINADIYSSIYGTCLNQQTGSLNVIINGNLEGYGPSSPAYTVGAGGYRIINGNIGKYSFSSLQGQYMTMNINGNIDCRNYPIATTGSATANNSLFINGTLEIGVRMQATTNLYTSFSLNGKIKFIGDYAIDDRSYFSAISATTILKINGVIDISEYTGKSYPILLPNQCEGDMIMSDVNVPQSVVLKGYEYGSKVGALEVVPSTAAIIEQATVIGSANVVEGDITNVNMTDEQLQRIANCATMQEVAELSITIANKYNEE